MIPSTYGQARAMAAEAAALLADVASFYANTPSAARAATKTIEELARDLEAWVVNCA